MKIRKFQVSDVQQIVRLFYETVHFVNRKDYTSEQLEAWASKDDENFKIALWKNVMSRHITYVALIDHTIVGFSDMTKKGYIDKLYVHKDFQRQGIASSLIRTLESEAKKLGLTKLNTDASITAKPFFEFHGYQLVQSQTVNKNNIELVNFKMTKLLN